MISTEAATQPIGKSSAAIRVMVVDDSSVVRQLITKVLESQPGIEVVGTAVDGSQALSKIERLKPDIITLDVEMPNLDGISTLRSIRKTNTSVRIIMCSTLTEHGARTTIQALNEGANEYVAKPTNVSNAAEALATLSQELIPKVRQFFPDSSAAGPVKAPAPTPPPRPKTRALEVPRQILAIGVSTGGPNALAVVLPSLPKDLAQPVVITQHMPPVFTRLLAQRLNENCALMVQEAAEGDVLQPGHIYIAPGDHHLTLRRDSRKVVVKLTQSAPENSCRPSVDVMFRSVAEVYGARTLAVVLTGMGSDGALGAEALKKKGALVLAQDEPSSVVWGMPGAVVSKGAADYVVPLQDVASTLLRKV